jgi:Ca2+-transporting ATPase
MLVFQNLPARDILKRSRSVQRPRFFSAWDWTRIWLTGAVATATIMGGYIFNLGDDLDVAHARSIALAVLIFAGSAITVALTRLRTRAAILATLLPVASVVAAVQIVQIADLLHLAPLHLIDWAIALAGGAAVAVAAAMPAKA